MNQEIITEALREIEIIDPRFRVNTRMKDSPKVEKKTLEIQEMSGNQIGIRTGGEARIEKRDQDLSLEEKKVIEKRKLKE